MFKFKINIEIGKEKTSIAKTRRYITFPQNFLSSIMCQSALLEFINKPEIGKNTQSGVDRWYNLFCNVLHLEMIKCQPRTDHLNKVQQRRSSKPYWNSHLEMLLNERKWPKGNFWSVMILWVDSKSRLVISKQNLYLIGIYDSIKRNLGEDSH